MCWYFQHICDVNAITPDESKAMKAEIARHRVQAHSFAAAQFVPTFNMGLRLAKADKDAKELRQWVEFMASMLGFVQEKETNNNNLAVVNITFGQSISAKPVETVDVQAKTVLGDDELAEKTLATVALDMFKPREPAETLPPLTLEELPDIGAELLEG